MIFIKFFKIPWYFQVFQVYSHFSGFSRLSGNPVISFNSMQTICQSCTECPRMRRFLVFPSRKGEIFASAKGTDLLWSYIKMPWPKRRFLWLVSAKDSGWYILSKCTILPPTSQERSTSHSLPRIGELQFWFPQFPHPTPNWTFSWRTQSFCVGFSFCFLTLRPPPKLNLLMWELCQLHFWHPQNSFYHLPPPPTHTHLHKNRTSHGDRRALRRGYRLVLRMYAHGGTELTG